jgi:hypothetical protein
LVDKVGLGVMVSVIVGEAVRVGKAV